MPLPSPLLSSLLFFCFNEQEEGSIGTNKWIKISATHRNHVQLSNPVFLHRQGEGDAVLFDQHGKYVPS
jgi:hypothetical protein